MKVCKHGHTFQTKRCSTCNKAKCKANYERNKEKHIASVLEWNKKNPEKKKEIVRRAMQKWRKANRELGNARARVQSKKKYAENKEAILAKNKAWRDRNKEKLSEQNQLRYRENLNTRLQSQKVYRDANREKIAAATKRWQKAHPEKINALSARRRAAKLQATPPWLTEQHFKQIELFYEAANDCQWWYNEKLHVDHIIPLQGKEVCGLHVPWNLQVIPQSDNIKKGNRT